MPENEDRRRFLAALGLRYCSLGQHTSETAYFYGQGTWCWEHPCPSGLVESKPGRCEWQRGHWADRVWDVPRDGRTYCATHFAETVRHALWGS